MINLLKVLFSVLLLLNLALVGFAQSSTLPEGVSRITSVEGVTEYHLDNGLKVLLFPDQSQQTITVNITYLVGSKHENYGEAGMAHLLEHLVFKGTPSHPNIPQEITTRGAGANGTTWTDRTNYYESFSATDENLDWALGLESDRMVNSFIAKKDLDSEFSVVRNELEKRENSDIGLVLERCVAVAYDWHNYGKPTIGTRSDLENVPIDRLKAFYKKYYQPDNAVLVVAGKINEAKTLELIKKKFGKIPRPKRILRQPYTVEPVQDGERTVSVRRKGEAKVVVAGYHTPPASHEDAAAVSAMVAILVAEPSGPLYKNLVETEKATALVNSSYEFREPGYTMFGARLRKEKSLEDARKILIETIQNFGNKPPSKEELERVKSSVAAGFERILSSPGSFGVSMSNYIARGDWRLFFIGRDRFKKVTRADVQRVAKKYLKTSNRTVGLFIPTEKQNWTKVPLVSDEQIAMLVKDYKGGAKIATGEAFDPSPKNIEARTTRSRIGGLKVAFLPKENRGDTVVANIVLHFGNEKDLMNRGAAAKTVVRLLRRGTAKRNRQQIKDTLSKIGATLVISGDASKVNVKTTTKRQHLSTVLKLIAEILREPSFPEKEFNEFKRSGLAGWELIRRIPSSVAQLSLENHFNPYPKGDFRYSGTIDEKIAELSKLTLADVKAFHRDFYGASNGELAVVGDFNPKRISSLVRDLFAGWESRSKYRRVRERFTNVPPVDKTIEIPDKASAAFLARLNLKISLFSPDYPALLLANNLIGGGFISSRLAVRIRQKDGLSYGVGSNLIAPTLDEAGNWQAYAIYAPQNLRELETAFKEEIQKIVSTGFTDKEVEEAKKGILRNRTMTFSSDYIISAVLIKYLESGHTLDWDAKFDAKIKSLTAKEVNAVVKKYIKPDKISIFKAGDFANAKKSKSVGDKGKASASNEN